MLNVIKMDLNRLFKSRSCYVILIILSAFIILNVYMIKYEMNSPSEAVNQNETVGTNPKDSQEDFNLGITYDASSLVKDQITVLDEVSVILTSGVILVFTGIFIVLFVCGESSSGYIKNIVSCTKERKFIILSKTVVASVFVFIEMIILLVMSTIGSALFLDNMKWNISHTLFQYIGLQCLLHIAFAVIIILISVLVRNTAISIVISICLCSGFGTLIVGFISKLQIGGFKFGENLTNYLVTTNVLYLPGSFTNNLAIRAIFVSIIAMLFYNLISCIVMEKRDI